MHSFQSLSPWDPVFKWLGLMLAALCIVGCSGVTPIAKKSRAISFESTTKTYGKLMRWGYFDEAAGYVRSKDGTAIEIDLDRIARYRVTSYKNTVVLLADEGSEGRVVAAIEFYEIDSGVLKTIRDEQMWWYDAESERWFLGSGLPPIGVAGD